MDDPCAPLRLQLNQIDEELRRRQQPPSGGSEILTPDSSESQLAGKTIQQLQQERQALGRRLAECEAAQGIR